MFNDILSPIVRAVKFRPMRISEPTAWIAHAPLAAALVDAMKPVVLVELGTHSGNSYFSFCQAVKESGLSTLCYAVDTWSGDQHAGHYAGSVFQSVADHNHIHYRDFSYLLRTSFRQALGQFSDESIDILHIDGLHTYEAVHDDYRNWIRKVRPGGAIILHDICARQKDFGVWRLWEEIQSQNPYTLSLFHSYGLGLVIKDHNLKTGSFITELVNKAQSANWQCFFSTLGTQILETYRLALPKRLKAQLFVGDQNGRFSETRSKECTFDDNIQSTLEFDITDMVIGSDILLRMDPSDGEGLLTLDGITICQETTGVRKYLNEIDIGKTLRLGRGVVAMDDKHSSFIITEKDPQIFLPKIKWVIEGSCIVRVSMSFTAKKGELANKTKELIEALRSQATTLFQIQQDFKDLAAEKADIEAALDLRDQRLVDLTVRLDHLVNLEDLNLLLKSMHEDAKTLRQSLENRDQKIAQLGASLAQLELSISKMSKSASWRLTYPLRAIHRQYQKLMELISK